MGSLRSILKDVREFYIACRTMAFPLQLIKRIQTIALALCVAGLLPANLSSALTVTSVTSDNGYSAHKVQWMDSAGQPRSAVMVDQNSTIPPYTGYLRQYSYQIGGQTRTCTGTENYGTGGNLEFSGDGFVQNHTGNGGDFSSGNGSGTPGSTTITLTGTNFARITYAMPSYHITDNNGISRTVPTTLQWFFADGRSDPIFAISQDARLTPGNVGADTRSPYGDMAYDGDGIHAYVGGASYGDTYKFVTLASGPEEVTAASGWKDTELNTIPYAMQWANPAQVDAEMGHVATVPITVYDQGSDSRNYPSKDPRTISKPSGPMLGDEDWAFQILNYQFSGTTPITTKRLAWGSNFGRVGGFYDYGDYPNTTANITNYSQHVTDPVGVSLTGQRASGMLLAYSVFVVFGPHAGGYTNGTVGKQVIQMQNAAAATLSAFTGSVATIGPAGVGNATNAVITYSPAGYNPTYSAWEIIAMSNAVNALLTPAANGPLDHPVFIIDNYTSAGLPTSIAVGSGMTNAGVNYFASVDTTNQQLWITIDRLVTNALNLLVSSSESALHAPAITSFSPASGAAGTSVTIVGSNFTGSTSVTFNTVPASGFMVNSSTQITATVPAGAVSGPIGITVPGGTILSANPFTVLAAQTNLPVYVDSLLNGFQDWSWAVSVNVLNSSPVYSGSRSISVSTTNYTALWLYHTPFNTSPFSGLIFWINGGAAGARGLQVMGVITNTYQALFSLPTLEPNTWAQFNIPLTALGVANVTNCQGFWIWPTLSGTTTFYVDSIQLNSGFAPTLGIVPPTARNGLFDVVLAGFSGQTYWIQTSTDLASWVSVSTNIVSSTPIVVTNTVIPNVDHQFWRAAWTF